MMTIVEAAVTFSVILTILLILRGLFRREQNFYSVPVEQIVSPEPTQVEADHAERYPYES